MNTKTLNTYEKLWLANRASHNMALAGPTAFWLASGHREARPLHYNFHKISIDNGQFCGTNPYTKLFFYVYRVYRPTMYFEILLLHCYRNYYTKYLIWCYGYNFHRIQ